MLGSVLLVLLPNDIAMIRMLNKILKKLIKAEEEAQEEADDDDAWKRFRKMTERVGAVVKESELRLDQLAATREVPEDDRMVQDYLAHTGLVFYEFSEKPRS